MNSFCYMLSVISVNYISVNYIFLVYFVTAYEDHGTHAIYTTYDGTSQSLKVLKFHQLVVNLYDTTKVIKFTKCC